MIRNDDNDHLATRGRTSICRSSVLNLGDNPRVNPGKAAGGAQRMPRSRGRRNYYPGHPKVLSLLLKCVPLVFGSVRRGFKAAMDSRPKMPDDLCICGTPLRPGVHDHVSEFFLLDVILHRARPQLGEGVAPLAERDPDAVANACVYTDSDDEDGKDYEYCAVLAFLPGAGTLYSHRERRKAETGLQNSFVQLDMSWLRLSRATSESSDTGMDRLAFGLGGYVRKLASDASADGGFVSAWKISRSYHHEKLSRQVYWASQCSDADGPRMPPDVIGGIDIGAWHPADRGQAFNDRLARSNSVRIGGRHYAPGCHHFRLPSDCLVIDGADNAVVDIVVDIAPIGNCTSRKSIIMVRQILSPTLDPLCKGEAGRPLMVEDLRFITLHNSLLRTRVPVGSARASRGDLGNMHPIGTRILLDGVTTAEYAANSKVPQRMLRKFVESLAKIGANCFPEVLAVMQDAEGDTGLHPVTPMADKGSEDRVAYSIDMSVDLGNASHFDVGDSSQGFSVWTEEVPGKAANWFFVMPNLFGNNNGAPFNGVAVKLYHGTAISWDGRVIRHCTSLTCPDGTGKPYGGGDHPTLNHVYGTFSAAKERIVNAGRCRAAAAAAAGCPVTASGDEIIAPHVGVDVVGAAGVNGDDNSTDDDDLVPWWDKVLPPYVPKIEDADPDGHPPPKDGSEEHWLCFYAQKKGWDKVHQPDEAVTADDDSSLFSRDIDDEYSDSVAMDNFDGEGHVSLNEDLHPRVMLSGDRSQGTPTESITAAMLMQGNYTVPRRKRLRY
ncbi:hypothetical protein MHU86_2151 [Fragilaria crotonensis]|nr:hypothetical protein MHU86_2151 [Fragilaria crotonensis]